MIPSVPSSQDLTDTGENVSPILPHHPPHANFRVVAQPCHHPTPSQFISSVRRSQFPPKRSSIFLIQKQTQTAPITIQPHCMAWHDMTLLTYQRRCLSRLVSLHTSQPSSLVRAMAHCQSLVPKPSWTCQKQPQ